MTLAEAQTELTDARAALKAARFAISLNDGSGKSLSRPDLYQLQREVAIWERRVNELTAAESGGVGAGYVVPSWD